MNHFFLLLFNFHLTRNALQGTVDSGHFCISGYNEVVMLRRLPEEHKVYAGQCLQYDAVHNLPHNVSMSSANIWPNKGVIEKWKSMK